MIKIIIFALMLFSFTLNAQAQTKKQILKDIYNKLNLASFRNSEADSRSAGDKYFSDLGLKITKISSSKLSIETDSWYTEITLLKVADINRDGITDYEICYLDQAKHGTYLTQMPLLLTKYRKGGDYIAISYQIYPSNCGRYKR